MIHMKTIHVHYIYRYTHQCHPYLHMYIHMYIYIYIHMYVCMYVCIYLSIYLSMYLCMYILLLYIYIYNLMIVSCWIMQRLRSTGPGWSHSSADRRRRHSWTGCRWYQSPCRNLARWLGWKTMNGYLVGGSATPLKNMKVNWDDDIPNIWENKKWQPNHQPAMNGYIWSHGIAIPKIIPWMMNKRYLHSKILDESWLLYFWMEKNNGFQTPGSDFRIAEAWWTQWVHPLVCWVGGHWGVVPSSYHFFIPAPRWMAERSNPTWQCWFIVDRHPILPGWRPFMARAELYLYPAVQMYIYIYDICI